MLEIKVWSLSCPVLRVWQAVYRVLCMLSIAAFTFNYDQVEDRILLVGNLNNNQERIDFWLTRKLVLRLLAAAPELVEKTSDDVVTMPKEHRSQMAQFHHDNAQQTLNVQKEEEKVVAQGGLLLSRLDISHQKGRYRILFFSHSEEPVAVSVLSYEELHQMLHLIHKGAQALNWGAQSVLFEAETSVTTLQ